MFHGETMVEAPFCTGHVEPRACGVKGLGYRAAYGVSHAPRRAVDWMVRLNEIRRENMTENSAGFVGEIRCFQCVLR
jgi:hypothetical protein